MTLIRFLLVVALAATVLTAQAGTYYVSDSTGNDANDGLTDTTAWQTLQFSVNQIGAGDTLFILAGTYFEKISIDTSGAMDNPMVIRSRAGEMAILDGTGLDTVPEAMVSIFDQSYIEIRGLVIRNNRHTDAQGILVEGNCQGIHILGNEIHDIAYSSNPSGEPVETDNAQPIIVYGTDANNAITDLVIRGNRVHDCQPGYSEGIAVNGNIDGFIIERNEVFNIDNIGIDAIGFEGTASANDQARNGVIRDNTVRNCKSLYASAAGIYIDGGANIIVESNTVSDCQWGIEVGCEAPGEAASGIEVRNNFIYDNDDAGIAFGGYDFADGGSGKVTSSIIRNNTILENDDVPDGLGGMYITYTESCSIINNLVVSSAAAPLVVKLDAASTGLSMNYNAYFSLGNILFDDMGMTVDSLAAWTLATNLDVNSLQVNPALEMLEGVSRNFHLTRNSALVNAGDPATVVAPDELDGYGEPRIEQEIIDIGADEFNFSLPVTYLSPFAAYRHGDGVELTWHTAEEILSDRFVVQRSTDLTTWEDLFTTPSVGQSHLYLEYDKQPQPGSNYYRLVQIDLDGTTSISAIRQVNITSQNGWQVFPNPAQDEIQLATAGAEVNAVSIWNMQGSLVMKREGLSLQRLSIQDLPAGSYWLQISTTEAVRSFKLIKK